MNNYPANRKMSRTVEERFFFKVDEEARGDL